MLGSYPSASVLLFMLAMFLLGFAIWGLTQRAFWRGFYVVLATTLTVWVCMSQFFLALHFLTDVLGAIVGATLIGWIASRFIDLSPRPNAEVQPARTFAAEAIQDLSHAHGIHKK
jgi:membrane-associated phospholipid phosphatase